MNQTFADAFRGTLDAGDVVLEFGHAQPGHGPASERIVELDVRIAMAPVTAKRLILTLNEAIQRQAGSARFRRLDVPADASAPGRGQTPINAPPDPLAERAAILLRLVGELGVPYQYERSFRMSADALAANRYLLTVNTRDIPGDPLERILEIVRRLGMPPKLHAATMDAFDTAHCVHFGFEGDAQSVIYKLYLERSVPELEAKQARAALEPVLLHLAFKWEVLTQAYVVTRYLWYPFYSVQQIEARLSEVYRQLDPSPSLEIAKSLLHLAAERSPAERLQYLEVHEDDNARWSFDLNVYDARLQVKDAQVQLQRMREHFGVRPGQFQALYDQIKNRPLGHVAGGVHRKGNDFFNVYYGVAGLPHFAERVS